MINFLGRYSIHFFFFFPSIKKTSMTKKKDKGRPKVEYETSARSLGYSKKVKAQDTYSPDIPPFIGVQTANQRLARTWKSKLKLVDQRIDAFIQWFMDNPKSINHPEIPGFVKDVKQANRFQELPPPIIQKFSKKSRLVCAT